MSISSADLESAFRDFYTRWQQLDEDTEWRKVGIVEQYGTSFLRIEKRIYHPGKQIFVSDEPEEDEDAESLPPSRARSDLSAVYDIVYSPSYQVPVLYLSFNNMPQPDPDTVYELLVPAAHREQMEFVGVMGALSLTEHPATGLPVYFVHPCRTQEIMRGFTRERQRQRPEEYLILWIGAIGASVGLNVPLELAGSLAGNAGAPKPP